MSEPETKNGTNGMSRIDLVLRILDRYGLATLGIIGIAWFAWVSIVYERETMMPTIELNTKAMERNSEVIRQLPAALRKEIIIDREAEKPHP